MCVCVCVCCDTGCCTEAWDQAHEALKPRVSATFMSRLCVIHHTSSQLHLHLRRLRLLCERRNPLQRTVHVPEWVRGGRRQTKEEDGGRDAAGAGLKQAL